LVLVMVLITVTLGIAAPKLTGFSRGSRNKDTAMQVMSLCRYARTAAISDARVYRLNIEGGSRYYLTVQDQDLFSPVTGDMGEQFQTIGDAQITLTRTDGGVPDHIDFYPDGRCDLGIIHLRQSDGTELQVVNDSPTQQYRLLRSDETLR
jgi:Tfp pilus assembly protein FimT